MKENSLFWIIGIIIVVGLVIYSQKGNETNTNSIINLFSIEDRIREDVMFKWEEKLSGDSGSKYLKDGMKTEKVRLIRIEVTGCGEEKGEAYLNNQLLGLYSFDDCDFLTFADGTGDSYIHYQTKTFEKLYYGTPTSPLLTSNKIEYKFTRNDARIIKKNLVVLEEVECITSSECVISSPFCDAVQHICLPKVTSCTNEYAPVCGVNGISYGNMCYSSMVGTSVSYNGLCKGDEPTDVKDEKGDKINLEDIEKIAVPIATTNTSIWVLIGVFIIVIIFLYFKEKNK